MTKNVPKTPFRIFFLKNDFRNFFSDLKICIGAKNLRNKMNRFGEKSGRTQKMVKNDQKRTVNTASDFFF